MRFLATLGILIRDVKGDRDPIHRFYHPGLSHILFNLETYSTGIKTDCRSQIRIYLLLDLKISQVQESL